MKRLAYSLVGVLMLLFGGCRKDYEAPVPYDFTNTPGSGRFIAAVRQAMEGVYTVSEGAGEFGGQVAMKWTYTFTGTDTTRYLSIFSGSRAAFFNLETDMKADSLVLNGFWRKLEDAETGLATLNVRVKRSGRTRAYDGRFQEGDTLVVNGFYGTRTNAPHTPITMTYARPLNRRAFSILAHRSGGRTSDLLPASENTTEVIKLASRLGATGVEVDVRYTKDGVPVLYHDNTLNLRLVQKNGLEGGIEDYTYQQLSSFVRLINGEKIPTLEEALETVIYHTPLTFVWLDTKYVGPMDKVQAIQQRYLEKARQAGRNVQIVIGLPSTDAVAQYQALPNKDNTPILCELDTAITRSVSARIWAPRWTLGPQTAEVRALKAQGLTVYVWTLDQPQFIQEFIAQNEFDGILSNYSSVVAYYHYTDQ